MQGKTSNIRKRKHVFITILPSKVYLLKDLSDSDLMSSNEIGKS